MNIFKPGKILLPKDTDLTKWSVVACDQYTSEPEYWDNADSFVGSSPSTLRITLPEIYLESDDVARRIDTINSEMRRYIESGLFSETDGYIFLRRTLQSGAVRLGIVGVCDLEEYDFTTGSKSLIRATEGTILERIPPRLAVRENAPLESPHIMMLIDDPGKTVIEPLNDMLSDFDKVYDFPLMFQSGHAEGWRVSSERESGIAAALEALTDSAAFNRKYGVSNEPVLLFAVGDGNHSLATAKTCYENLKAEIGDAALEHPARYALIELVNIHDPALEFEAIHRIMFEIDPDELLIELERQHMISAKPMDVASQRITIVREGRREDIYICTPTSNLAVGTLQSFLDQYMREVGGRVDYIHGDDVVEDLTLDPDCIGFILPDMKKSELFKTVILDGALPRKTFSMGHACDKRFYLECRKIQK